jgi:hypothetical protein
MPYRWERRMIGKASRAAAHASSVGVIDTAVAALRGHLFSEEQSP